MGITLEHSRYIILNQCLYLTNYQKTQKIEHWLTNLCQTIGWVVLKLYVWIHTKLLVVDKSRRQYWYHNTCTEYFICTIIKRGISVGSTRPQVMGTIVRNHDNIRKHIWMKTRWSYSWFDDPLGRHAELLLQSRESLRE